MTEERYDKHNILAIPDLTPERSYESEGVVQSPDFRFPTQKPVRELKIIDDLDELSALADLVPPEIGDIIRNINKVLSEDSQGKLIIELQRERDEAAKGSEPTVDSGGHDNNDGVWSVDVDHNGGDGDYEVDDIFSSAPAFTVEVAPSESLVELARKAYKDDDLDIKTNYVSMMTQIIARFYQVMSTLATDGGMPDYSYLMRDFDGTAVKTSDENQKHLIDSICKNQIIYDQRLRQMNLTHTAENTLVMTRGFSAAEAQRERYFGEKFKANMNDTASTLSNDILEKERQRANDKYKDAAYNMYKYLDSATKFTNALLNIRIDEGAAKVQLSNTGSDIYAVTPPPPPTADNIDDGFETTQQQTEAAVKYVQDAQKDSVTGAQAMNGYSPGGGGGPARSVSATAETKSIFNALIGLGYNDVAACGIMGNIQQECGFNVESGRYESQAACGLFQWGNNCDGGRWQRLLSMYPDPACWNAGNQLSYMFWECENGYSTCLPATLNNFSTPEEAAVHFEEHFEGAGIANNENRMSYARQFYNLYKQK